MAPRGADGRHRGPPTIPAVEPTPGAVNIILAAAAVFTVVTLVRSWRSFWDADFTTADRRLAIQLSVFVVPPVVVLLHELGHVAAAVGTGTRVTGFSYGLFEGSVSIAGRITFAESWFIALAGNLVSIAAGLILVLAGVWAERARRAVRYLLVVSGLVQLAFALIGYPVLSLTSGFGDWEIIYQFDRTPELSWATLAAHAGALVVLWRWFRRRGRALLFAVGAGVESELATRQRAVEQNPGDEAARLELARFYLERGETGLARAALDDAASGTLGTPRVHLARARLALHQQRWNDSFNAARAGLDAASGRPDDEIVHRLWANMALALGQMERPEHALDAFSHVGSPVALDARVTYGRGLARIATGDTEGGAAELNAVVAALPEGHLLRVWAEAKLGGRNPDPPDDSDLPPYARRSAPPPAPIAGV